MTYAKPELLATEAALDAIRGAKGFLAQDSDVTIDQYTNSPAYEVDE